MSCRACGSGNQRTFESEINIHFPELGNVKKLPALAFPILLICLDCGFIEARLSDSELSEAINFSGSAKGAAD
jgi:hypothetical protein